MTNSPDDQNTQVQLLIEMGKLSTKMDHIAESQTKQDLKLDRLESKIDKKADKEAVPTVTAFDALFQRVGKLEGHLTKGVWVVLAVVITAVLGTVIVKSELKRVTPVEALAQAKPF